MVKPVVEVEVVIVVVVEDLAVVGVPHPTSKGAVQGGSVVGGVLTMLRVSINWSNPYIGVAPKKPKVVPQRYDDPLRSFFSFLPLVSCRHSPLVCFALPLFQHVFRTHPAKKLTFSHLNETYTQIYFPQNAKGSNTAAWRPKME
jgi:hypothetical protein